MAVAADPGSQARQGLGKYRSSSVPGFHVRFLVVIVEAKFSLFYSISMRHEKELQP